MTVASPLPPRNRSCAGHMWPATTAAMVSSTAQGSRPKSTAAPAASAPLAASPASVIAAGARPTEKTRYVAAAGRAAPELSDVLPGTQPEQIVCRREASQRVGEEHRRKLSGIWHCGLHLRTTVPVNRSRATYSASTNFWKLRTPSKPLPWSRRLV